MFGFGFVCFTDDSIPVGFGGFLFRFGLLGFLLLFGYDEVRPFQMLLACNLFRDAPFHLQTLSQNSLHLAHGFLVQLAGLACFVVHPIPNDVGMKIGLPCGWVLWVAVMPLVTMDEHLQGCDTPSLLTHLTEMMQLLHCGIFFNNHDTFFEWSAATHDGHLACLFVHFFTVFGLHFPTSLFLDHCGYLIVAVSQ